MMTLTSLAVPSPGSWTLMRSLACAGSAALLLALPWVGGKFLIMQLVVQSMALGLIAMSLSFLAGQLGMVSLAQTGIAGVAAYTVAIAGPSGSAVGLGGWPAWAAIGAALVLAVVVSLAVGWLCSRTEGVYTIMTTLAVGIAFSNLALQNYAVFNGFNGFNGVKAPQLLPEHWGAVVNLYYLVLAMVLSALALTAWLMRSTFGLAINGVRDNPRRMRAMGYRVTALRVAAFGVAGLIAALGGIALLWFDQFITPGRIGINAMVDLLIVSMLGGVKRPQAAFIGALLLVLLRTFAIDVTGPERFNLLIGVVFIAIVVTSEDGLSGWLGKRRSKP